MGINDTTNRLAGTANISVGGVTYLLAADFTWSDFDVERETLAGMDGVHGYSEKPKAPFISATFRDSNGITVKDFNAMTNANISASLANGKTIIGSGMWCVSPGDVKSMDGTFEVKFEGRQGSVIEN